MRERKREGKFYLDKDPDGIEVRKVDYLSNVNGSGLFATKDFQRNDFIVNYRGVHCESAESDPFVYKYEFNGKTRFIDARDPKSGLGRYVNDIDPYHVANAKATKLVYHDDDDVLQGTIAIKAVTDIKAGLNHHLILDWIVLVLLQIVR